MSEIKVKTKVISLKPYLDSDTAEEMVDSRKVKIIGFGKWKDYKFNEI